MKRDESTRAWNEMGEEWIRLALQDESRLQFIMPYMLQLMGKVNDRTILDLGCGEGGYAIELAKRGAVVTGADGSTAAIAYAQKTALQQQLPVTFMLANSCDLASVGAESFDIVLCSMMLMDCSDLAGTVKEAARVLKPGGRMYASVLHPCFDGNHQIGIGRQGEGIDRQVVVKKLL